jgi:hypothetical protein
MAERSPVFWKTLYNWCRYIEEGSLPPDAILRFVVVANGTVAPGGIQESFGNASTDEDSQKALAAAKAIILGSAQDDPAADAFASLPGSYRDYVRYLFDNSRAGIVCGVIKRMEIEIHNGSYDRDLIERFCNQTIPMEYADVLLKYMLGWVTERVESFTKDNRPAYVSAKDYRDALNAQVRASNVGTILLAVSRAPTTAEAGSEVKRLDTYIRQLELIAMDETVLFEAASDYLRTKVDKIEWAQRGIVTAQSFDDYNDALCRVWNSLRRLAASQFGTDQIRCGQALYFQCKLDSGRQRLQGVETPPFFGSGSLHSLANAPIDSPRIGWHPQYIDLLKGGRT